MNLKTVVEKYFNVEGTNPIFLGFISGIYPFLFYVSNNFYATNSLLHWGYFLLFFVGIPILIYLILFPFLNIIPFLKKWKKHILFIAVIFITAFFLSWASSFTIKKKILLGVLIIAALLSLKLYDRFKKLFILVGILCFLPILKIGYKFYKNIEQKEWLQQPDKIENITLKKTPNVYVIQPDGYVNRETMEGDLYNYKSDLYAWLENQEFKVYPNFRSNYPASLNSNSSLFAMRQHRFGSSLMPDFEMPYAREVISGDNPVVSIFKKNGYHTFFIAEDEYFQQNLCSQLYDYINIDLKEIKFFSRGNSVVRDVLQDIKTAFDVKTNKSKFFFVEKCLPHHVHFYAEGDRIQEERKEYLQKIEEVNDWLKETISFISERDPEGIIVILADHGGWVGMYNYNDMFTTKNAEHINSIYSSLLAIKWNGNLIEGYDDDLKTNVNLFRVLFANLTGEEKYLENLEDNSSYNLNIGNSLFKSVIKVINDDGNVVYEKQ